MALLSQNITDTNLLFIYRLQKFVQTPFQLLLKGGFILTFHKTNKYKI